MSDILLFWSVVRGGDFIKMMAQAEDDDESESVRDLWLRDTGAGVSQDYLSCLAAGADVTVLRHTRLDAMVPCLSLQTTS